MGRIKTKKIKSMTHHIMEQHGDRLTTSFESNKKVVGAVSIILSKKIRNIVAGYCTRLMRMQKKAEAQ